MVEMEREKAMFTNYPLEYVASVDYPPNGRLISGVVFQLGDADPDGGEAYVFVRTYRDGQHSVVISPRGPNGHWVGHGQMSTSKAGDYLVEAARKAASVHLDLVFRALGAEPEMFTTAYHRQKGNDAKAHDRSRH